MTTVVERLAYINSFPRPVITEPVAPITADTVRAVVSAHRRHLRTADTENLAHLVTDAEYLPASRVAKRLRAAADQQRAARASASGAGRN